MCREQDKSKLKMCRTFKMQYKLFVTIVSLWNVDQLHQKYARAYEVCYTTRWKLWLGMPLILFWRYIGSANKDVFFVKFLSLQFTIFSSFTYLSCHFSLAEYVLYVEFETNVSASMVVVTYNFVKFYSKYIVPSVTSISYFE